MPVTYINIASTTLGSDQASITFSSIPGTYTDLVLKASIRGTVTSGAFDLQARLTFNGDTATNYSRTWIYGNGSSVFAGRNSNTANIEPTALNSSTSTAGTFSRYQVYIPSYTASRNKPIFLSSGAETNATLAYLDINAGLWRNTAAITSLTLTANINNFAAGSSFYLYGIKNS